MNTSDNKQQKNFQPFLIIPKQLAFTSTPLKALKIQNPSMETIVYKIKSNNKTALSINSTHDFIGPKSIKQIHVKLLEVMENIKLQINYAQATQQMINKNDSKMINIDKKNIKKVVIKINTEGLPTNQNVIDKVLDADELALFSSTLSDKQKIEIPEQFAEKQTSSNISQSSNFYKAHTSSNSANIFTPPTGSTVQNLPQSGITEYSPLETVEQHQEQDLYDLQQAKRQLNKELVALEEQINTKSSILESQNQLVIIEIHEHSIVKPKILFIMILVTFLLGGVLRAVIMN